MTIALTGTGGLFTRVGRCGGLLNAINAFRGTANLSAASIVSIGTGIDNVEAQFASTNQQLVDALYAARNSHRLAHSQLATYLQGLSQQVVVTMADDDVRLVTKSLSAALETLISQMTAASASVPRPTVSVGTITAGSSNAGNGACVASITGKTGVQRDYVFAENIDLTVTSDSALGATQGREPLSLLGDAAQADPLWFEWEDGSGASATLNAVDAAEDAGTNLLTNGDFETFSVANTPDNFSILDGTAGTHIFSAGSSDAYAGSNGLKYTGNGSTNPSIAQTFNLSGTGTAGRLLPNTVYAFNCWLKKSATATGILAIELVDGSNAIIADDATTNNALTKDISTLTTSFAAFNGFFRTPRNLPSTVKLRIRTSTAINSGQSVFLDHAAMCAANEAYTGGPYVAVFSGSSRFVKGDTFVIPINNNYGSGWQRLAERFFGMRTLGLQLPSSASPTISDSLIA